MAVTAQPYGQFLADVTKGVHSLGADPDYVALLTSAYSPDLAGHGFYAAVSAAETAGAGYTAGGAAPAITAAPAGNATTALVACADLSWASVTVTFRYAVLYKRTAGAAAAAMPLIALFDFGTDRTYTASPLKLSFPNGIMTLSKG